MSASLASLMNVKMQGECPFLSRVNLEPVMQAAGKLWEDREIAMKIGLEACDLIRRSYCEKPFFFSKTLRGLLGGLFYILGFKNNDGDLGVIRTQHEIALALGTTESTVRIRYNDWLEEFPWLDNGVRDLIAEKTRRAMK